MLASERCLRTAFRYSLSPIICGAEKATNIGVTAYPDDFSAMLAGASCGFTFTASTNLQRTCAQNRQPLRIESHKTVYGMRSDSGTIETLGHASIVWSTILDKLVRDAPSRAFMASP